MSYDLSILLLRVIVGGLMFAHGTQKLFGWFGGHGFNGTRAWLQGQLRLRPAPLWTAMAGLAEGFGGLLLATGFLTPFGSVAIIGIMLTAIILTHWPRIWVAENGFEYNLVLITAAAAIAIAGPGAYSLDAVLGLAVPAPATFLVGLALVLAGVALVLATRRPAATRVTAVEEAPARAA
jgi:putative oxidoreductase